MNDVLRFGKHVKYGDFRHWLEFYPKWTRASFCYSVHQDEDERASISTQITTILALICLYLAFIETWLFIFPFLSSIYFSWGTIHLYLPITVNKDKLYSVDEPPQYGWYNYGHNTVRDLDSFWILWKKAYHIFYYPWTLKHHSSVVRLNDGTWEKYSYPDNEEKYDLQEYEYTYTLKNGEVQKTIATVYQVRREWRMRMLPFIPFLGLVRTSIEVNFQDQIGERVGSWKGGVLGTGYDMKKSESMLACLRRMEKEQKFT